MCSKNSDLSWVKNPKMLSSVIAPKVQSINKRETELLLKLRANAELYDIVEKMTKICEKVTQEASAEQQYTESENTFFKKLKADRKLFHIVSNVKRIFECSGITGKLIELLIENIHSIKDVDSKIYILKKVVLQTKEMGAFSALESVTVKDKESISTGKWISGGSSSDVFEGVFKKEGTKKKVVIKVPKLALWYMVFKNEAAYLNQLNHMNIVKLFGITQNTPAIVLELMEFGALNSALENHSFSDLELLKINRDIAAGMEYVHSKHFLHRDLACRNVFVNSKKQAKIGDFGTAVYVGHEDGKYFVDDYERFYGDMLDIVPPEILENGIFTYGSDVWAAGIIIWKMYGLFENHSHWEDSIILALFRKGLPVLKKPTRCPASVWKFAMDCMLIRDRNQRSNFSEIKDTIDKLIKQS